MAHEAPAERGTSPTSATVSPTISHMAGAWVAIGDVAAERGDSARAADLYRRAAEALQDVRW